MKDAKSIIFFILALSAASICFAKSDQAESLAVTASPASLQAESLTITAYYPSPYGIYRNLKFAPIEAVPSGPALSPGVIYYNNTDDVLRYYNKTGKWVNLTGGGSVGYWAYNSVRKDIYNTNQGKVIIEGTASNDDLLYVNGNVRLKNEFNDTTFRFGRVGASGTSSESLIFKDPVTDLNSWSLGSTKSSPAHLIIGNISLATNSPIYQVRVFPSGNVGLRTSTSFWNAEAKLDIAGTYGGSPYQRLISLEGDGTVRFEMESASDFSSRGPEICALRAEGSLTSPQAVPPGYSLLEVQFNGYIPSSNDQRRGGEWGFLSGGSSPMSSTSSPGAVAFGNTPNGVFDISRLAMLITDAGNVGVGNAPWTVNEKFLVIVNSAISGFVDSATGAWQPPSDKRLKNNISGIEDALAKVVRVRGIRYDPITETSSSAKKGNYLGFIGQDLEKEFPELVSTDSKGYKSVSYEIMTPVLVEAIKEQKNQIESLRKEIQVLKSRKKKGHLQGAI